jgi:hypothetical protein
MWFHRSSCDQNLGKQFVVSKSKDGSLLAESSVIITEVHIAVLDGTTM